VSDFKDRARKALEAFSKKDLKEIDKLTGKKRKNQKPEKLVEAECLFWMRQQRWSCQIIESKATCVNGVWRNQAVQAGTVDCLATLPNGMAAYIEFKAFGKLSTFNRPGNERQVQYVKSKIQMNAFACVTDSAERLKTIYETWEQKREISLDEARDYLLSMLP